MNIAEAKEIRMVDFLQLPGPQPGQDMQQSILVSLSAAAGGHAVVQGQRQAQRVV